MAEITHAELERRRQEPGKLAREFWERHGGEYCGGPVDWHTGRPRREADTCGASEPAST